MVQVWLVSTVWLVKVVVFAVQAAAPPPGVTVALIVAALAGSVTSLCLTVSTAFVNELTGGTPRGRPVAGQGDGVGLVAPGLRARGRRSCRSRPRFANGVPNGRPEPAPLKPVGLKSDVAAVGPWSVLRPYERDLLLRRVGLGHSSSMPWSLTSNAT